MLNEPRFAVPIISIQAVFWIAHRKIAFENNNNRFKANNSNYTATSNGWLLVEMLSNCGV
jgi:hypothetical protein